MLILCGGQGEHKEDSTFPKPLNLIQGKPSIAWCLKGLPEEIKELHFVYCSYLKEYNFETIIQNEFKKKKCFFYCVDYFTRGPLETGYIAVKKAGLDQDKPIIFLDDDVVLTWKNQIPTGKTFVGVKEYKETDGEDFAFVKYENHRLSIYEKEKVSNTCCIGVYGFKSVDFFCESAKKTLQGQQKNEYYFSTLLNEVSTTGETIELLEFSPENKHLSSRESIVEYSNQNKKQLRICFDIDNTLVTLPRIPGDYTSVEPIPKTINFLKKLKKEGHTIILYTARRMLTHQGNIGKVIKDIGKITFETLYNFGIEYDEIYFGKPYADVYIDDKAVNPYRNDYDSMGLFCYSSEEQILNSLPPNSLNTIAKMGNKVVKSGPAYLLDGQVYFYKQIPKSLKYFPNLIGTQETNDTITIELDYIRGIPLFHLQQYELFSKEHLRKLDAILKELHSTACMGPLPTKKQIYTSYVEKFTKRLGNKNIYCFPDVEEVKDYILAEFYTLMKEEDIEVAQIIHGDFWFSNILITYEGEIKCIDMRGKVGDLLTLGGDPNYDYAKLLQSLLGYDCKLWEREYREEYRKELLEEFWQLVSKKQEVFVCSILLMLGTLEMMEESKRQGMWDWITKKILSEYKEVKTTN